MGKLLYVMVGGKQPLDFPDAPTLADTKDRRIYSTLNPVLLKACDGDPKRRYAGATGMRSALNQVLTRTAKGGAVSKRGGAGKGQMPSRSHRHPSRSELKRELVQGIHAHAVHFRHRRRGGTHYLMPGELRQVTTWAKQTFEEHCGFVPREAQLVCKLAEVAHAPNLSDRTALLKEAVTLSEDLTGVGTVIKGVGAALGWDQDTIASVTKYFTGACVLGPFTWIVGGLTLAGIAGYFALTTYDPEEATDNALRALEHGLGEAIDQVWPSPLFRAQNQRW